MLPSLTYGRGSGNLLLESTGREADPLKQKVVARYRDGRVVKGFTEDFTPKRESFTLSEEEGRTASRIGLEELKAIFFVKSLEGDRNYSERKLQIPEKPMGKQILISFEDGEVIRGSALGVNLTPLGFFLFPADPGCNNKRIFVIKSAVKELKEE
jgi:hypothetical protein